MKILIFSSGYFPAQKYGGPVSSLFNFSENLGETLDIDVVCLDHDLKEKTPLPDIRPGFNTVGKAQVLYIPDKKISYKYFLSLISERKPDCIYISSIFTFRLNFPILRIAKRYGLKVVYAPRGELADNVLKLKFLKKQIFLFVMRHSGLYKGIYFQATSDREKLDTVRRLKVPEKMVFTLPNLPPKPLKRTCFSKEKGKLKIVFLSRIHKSKNLRFAIECVLPLSGDITFDIYGPIEHEEYWKSCQKLISSAPENVKINYCGMARTGTSKSVFAEYDCFLFPTISENYSQAIAECISALTVPVISRGTTPWDDLEGCGGFTLPLDDKAAFSNALQKLCDMNEDDYRVLGLKLADYREYKLNTEELCSRYLEMFEKATKDNAGA